MNIYISHSPMDHWQPSLVKKHIKFNLLLRFNFLIVHLPGCESEAQRGSGQEHADRKEYGCSLEFDFMLHMYCF